jgi:hypothetical protein
MPFHHSVDQLYKSVNSKKKIDCLEIEPVHVDCSISVSMASLFTFRLAH